jgi:hypothetical protein
MARNATRKSKISNNNRDLAFEQYQIQQILPLDVDLQL